MTIRDDSGLASPLENCLAVRRAAIAASFILTLTSLWWRGPCARGNEEKGKPEDLFPKEGKEREFLTLSPLMHLRESTRNVNTLVILAVTQFDMLPPL